MIFTSGSTLHAIGACLFACYLCYSEPEQNGAHKMSGVGVLMTPEMSFRYKRRPKQSTTHKSCKSDENIYISIVNHRQVIDVLEEYGPNYMIL